jgi:putative membrane protein
VTPVGVPHEHDVVPVILVLAACSAIYLAGVWRLWRAAGTGRGIGFLHITAFVTAMLLLAAALASPLAELSRTMFSAHMVVHEILMVAAAPLLVLSRPLAAVAWLVPGTAARLKPPLSASFRWLASPLAATVLQGAAIWLWHVPDFFRAAVTHDGLHLLQHITFFGSALLFWHAMHRIGRSRYGAATGYLFLTSVHTNFLGALLTLSPHVLYPAAGGFGMSPLEDQQLGGIIMWMPGGVAYAVAAFIMAGRWISRSRAMDTSELRTLHQGRVS